LLGSLEFQS